jgi:hypothetical protein
MWSCRGATIQRELENGGRGLAIVGVVAGQRLVKILRAEKYLACDLVICKVWKLENGGRGLAIVGVVAGQRLVKTLRAEKDLACDLVICKVWKLAIMCSYSLLAVSKANIQSKSRRELFIHATVLLNQEFIGVPQGCERSLNVHIAS